MNQLINGTVNLSLMINYNNFGFVQRLNFFQNMKSKSIIKYNYEII